MLARATEVQPSDEAAAEACAERLAQIPSIHPRLHFDASGAEQIRQRARNSHRRYAEQLYSWVARNRDWRPPARRPDSAGNEVLLEQTAAFVTNAALAYVSSNDPKHLELARRWTLAMCDLPRDTVRNYGLGIYLAGLARAYDWLYACWTDAERRRIRSHLRRHIDSVYLGSFPEHPQRHWWAGAHLHHDYWIPVGGYGEAALALLGEADDASRWAARAKVDFDICLSWLGDDGAWHEGVADWCYTLAPLLWFYGAWQTAVGEDLHQVPWLKNTARYRLYHWLPDDTYVYLNDSFRSGRYNTSGSAACHLLRRLAALFHDSHIQWLAERDERVDLLPGPKGVYQAPYERSSLQATRRHYPHTDSQCAAWNLLWYDPGIAARAPRDLQVAYHFSNMDVAILRTGWDAGAAVVSLACGPLAGHRCARRIRAGEPRTTSNYSHAHVDYASFTLYARGNYLVVPAGYARRSSHFQNSVSVNGADLRADPAADVRIVAFQTDTRRNISYAVADATNGFGAEAGVQRHRRHLLLAGSGRCIVFDDLELKSRRTRSWNRFQWSIHTDPRVHQVRSAGTRLSWETVATAESLLNLHVFEPQEFAWEHAQLDPLDGEPMLEVHRIVRPEWYSDRMHVLAVFSWEPDRPAPLLVRDSRFLAIETGQGPLLGFALTPIDRDALRPLAHPRLQGREMLLFGWNRVRPQALPLVVRGE